MNNKNFTHKAPFGFGHCYHSDCSASSCCLRHLATQAITPDDVNINIINPSLVRPADGTACPYFRELRSIRTPYGFKRTLNSLTRSDAAAVRRSLIAQFSYGSYYNYLKGDYPIPLDKVETITDTLSRHGATTPIEFDRYEEDFEW